MKGYWITLCHVTDSETYGEYIKLAGPAIQKYGGTPKGIRKTYVNSRVSIDSYQSNSFSNSKGKMLR